MLEDTLSYEEMVVLRSILLERSTYYTSKIVETKTNMLKCANETDVDAFISDYNYYLLKKEIVNKVNEYLKKV